MKSMKPFYSNFQAREFTTKNKRKKGLKLEND